MTAFQLAQINIAATKEPLESPVMAEFVANLDRINELAERSAGFVWRLKGEGNDATSLRPLGENVIVNMSVWDGIESLNAYVYRSAHTEIMRRRREWFDRMREMHMALWWVRRGHHPALDEAIGRLEHLRQHGPTGFAFTFRTAFPPPDAMPAAEPFLGGECPAR